MKNKTAYDYSRSNLLAAIIFTVINVVLVFLETDTMFLFSATIPYYFALLAYYWELYGYFAVSAVVLLIYIACWYFSKNHKAWLIVALIMFIIDTLFMLWLYDFQFDASVIIDIVFHGWIIFYLVSGIIYKGNKSLEEKEVILEINDEIDNETSSSYLRLASDCKSKIFLEEYVLGKHVVYRRVKTVNELVINGKVYDEYEALVEKPHNLQAKINGHLIEVGIAATSQMYISVDKEIIKKKMRWI